MKKTLFALVALALAPVATAKDKPLATDEDKTLYAIGVAASDSFKVFQLTPAELAIVQRGLSDALAGKASPAVDMKVYGPKVNQLAAKRTEAAGKKVLEAWAKKPGAKVLPSGMVYLSTTEGTGRTVGPLDFARVQYEAKLADGKVVDSSRKGGKPGPVDVPMEKVIKCWKEGLALMKVGGKATLVCPSSLAYGDAGMAKAGIPGGATMIFDIEFISVPVDVKEVQATEKDVEQINQALQAEEAAEAAKQKKQ